MILLSVQPVECSNPDGVDYGWVMQMTFVTMILVGSSIIAILSVNAGPQMWDVRAEPAIRAGAVIWSVTTVVLSVYTKRANASGGGAPPETELNIDIDTED